MAQVFESSRSARGSAQWPPFGQDMEFIGPDLHAGVSSSSSSGVLLTEDGNWDWSEWFILLGLVGWALCRFVAFAYLTRAMGGSGARWPRKGRARSSAPR